MRNDYFSGQGEIFLAERSEGGNPVDPFVSVGDAPVFEVGLGVEKTDIRESISGFRRTALSLQTGQNSTITMNLRIVSEENAALMLYGIVLEVAQSVIANEPFENGITAGEAFFLDVKGKVSSLVITDSAGGGAATVTNTKYAHDGYGYVTFLDVTGYTQPFKAAYTAAAYKKVPLLMNRMPERWLRFIGRNTAAFNGDGSFKRVMLDLYRVQFDPVETLPFIQESDVASLAVSGNALEDQTKPITQTSSRFGDFYFLD
jgi:hypothetical protein